MVAHPAPDEAGNLSNLLQRYKTGDMFRTRPPTGLELLCCLPGTLESGQLRAVLGLLDEDYSFDVGAGAGTQLEEVDAW